MLDIANISRSRLSSFPLCEPNEAKIPDFDTNNFGGDMGMSLKMNSR